MKKFITSAAILFGSLTLSNAALVGWWNFNDGTANDSSGNDNHGTFQNGAGPSGNVPTGGGAGSLSILGGNSHVLVPGSVSLDIPNAITITAWVRPATPGWGAIVAKAPWDGGSGLNQAGNYELRLDQGNLTPNFGWELGSAPNQSNFVLNTTPLPVGQWSHLAFTMDSSSNFVFYLNGASIGGGIALEPFGGGVNNNPLYIGTRADFFTTMNGNLDEIGIWNTALSANEINTVFTDGIIPEPSAALLGLLGVLGLAARRRR